VSARGAVLSQGIRRRRGERLTEGLPSSTVAAQRRAGTEVEREPEGARKGEKEDRQQRRRREGNEADDVPRHIREGGKHQNHGQDHGREFGDEEVDRVAAEPVVARLAPAKDEAASRALLLEVEPVAENTGSRTARRRSADR